MKAWNKYIEELNSGVYSDRLMDIYLDSALVPYQTKRYVDAVTKFATLFGEKEVQIYSAPGRSEVSGNHTDHQHGHVLATSINLDAIGVVAPTNDNIVHLVSGESDLIEIDLSDLFVNVDEKETTNALIR